MSRALVFGNGRLHVGLDTQGLVRDLYFPYVGLERQLPNNDAPHRIGIFVDGRISWTHESNWQTTVNYHDSAMVGSVISTNDELGIRLEFTDAISSEYDVFIRSIHVVNLREQERDIKVFCHQSFVIGESAESETVQYRPDLPAIMHYKGNRVFLACLTTQDGYFDDYSVGKCDATQNSGTYRDAEDGRLEKNAVENGCVDSIMGVSVHLRSYDSARLCYWLLADTSIATAEQVFEKIASVGPLHFLVKSASHSQHQLERTRAIRQLLPMEYRQHFEQSLTVLFAHLDARGAVLAGLDSGLRNHPEDDAYNFCWPRDAAYVLWPLLRFGYTEPVKAYFAFALKGLHADGYLYHKYRADGSLGSTWLPYMQPDGQARPPIQSDETASTLFLIGQYYRHTNDQAFVVEYFGSLVEPMANFLAGFVGTDGLPAPSYDLWEHSYGTHTYTAAITYAALLEAVELATAYGRTADADRWLEIALRMKQSAQSELYNPETKYFYKSKRSYTTDVEYDPTIDISSLYGSFMYGLFDLDSIEISSAIETVTGRLVQDNLCSRFEGDDYYGDGSHPNAWVLATLWLAEIALERDDTATAKRYVDATLQLATSSGMLPEQVRRNDSGSCISVTPLAWSHAELLNTLLDFVQTENSYSGS